MFKNAERLSEFVGDYNPSPDFVGSSLYTREPISPSYLLAGDHTGSPLRFCGCGNNCQLSINIVFPP